MNDVDRLIELTGISRERLTELRVVKFVDLAFVEDGALDQDGMEGRKLRAVRDYLQNGNVIYSTTELLDMVTQNKKQEVNNKNKRARSDSAPDSPSNNENRSRDNPLTSPSLNSSRSRNNNIGMVFDACRASETAVVINGCNFDLSTATHTKDFDDAINLKTSDSFFTSAIDRIKLTLGVNEEGWNTSIPPTIKVDFRELQRQTEKKFQEGDFQTGFIQIAETKALDLHSSNNNTPFFMPCQQVGDRRVYHMTGMPDVASKVTPMEIEIKGEEKKKKVSDKELRGAIKKPAGKCFEALSQAIERVVTRMNINGFVRIAVAFAVSKRSAWIVIGKRPSDDSSSDDLHRYKLTIDRIEYENVVKLWVVISEMATKNGGPLFIDDGPRICNILTCLGVNAAYVRVRWAAKSSSSVYLITIGGSYPYSPGAERKAYGINVCNTHYALKLVREDTEYESEKAALIRLAPPTRKKFYALALVDAGVSNNFDVATDIHKAVSDSSSDGSISKTTFSALEVSAASVIEASPSDASSEEQQAPASGEGDKEKSRLKRSRDGESSEGKGDGASSNSQVDERSSKRRKQGGEMVLEEGTSTATLSSTAAVTELETPGTIDDEDETAQSDQQDDCFRILGDFQGAIKYKTLSTDYSDVWWRFKHDAYSDDNAGAVFMKHGNVWDGNVTQNVVDDVLTELERGHREGVLHCDLRKPNIASFNGIYRPIDYGLSLIIQAGGSTSPTLSRSQINGAQEAHAGVRIVNTDVNDNLTWTVTDDLQMAVQLFSGLGPRR